VGSGRQRLAQHCQSRARAIWWQSGRAGLPLLCLLGCTHSGASPPSPEAALAGCYVILGAQSTGDGELELLFPSFFALDSLPAPAAAIPGRRVLLPRDDMARRAGSWSWSLGEQAVVVQAVGTGEGWRLEMHLSSTDWTGVLTGWAPGTTAGWNLNGRRVPCPRGMVPAAI